jgi:lysozyme family protein
MDRNFERALPLVLKHEGGFANHPKDPGGATMKGVTLATFRRYKPGASVADLKAISAAMLGRIYRDGYWNKVRGDDLPSGVDYAVFDFAVNSGPGRAAEYLQAIAGVAPDGEIGPKTLAAVAKLDPAAVINSLCNRRMAFLQRLKTWPTFKDGWTSRVADVRKKALAMVGAPSTSPASQPTAPKTGFWAWLISLFTKG